MKSGGGSEAVGGAALLVSARSRIPDPGSQIPNPESSIQPLSSLYVLGKKSPELWVSVSSYGKHGLWFDLALQASFQSWLLSDNENAAAGIFNQILLVFHTSSDLVLDQSRPRFSSFLHRSTPQKRCLYPSTLALPVFLGPTPSPCGPTRLLDFLPR